MQSHIRIVTIALLLWGMAFHAEAQVTVTGSEGNEVTITDASRIITLGSDVTETVYALGAGSKVVAVDASSTYPQAVHRLPKVPYVRQLTAEGILSLNPTLIISTEGAKPMAVLEQIRGAGTPVLLVTDEPTPEAVAQKIETIGHALQKSDRADELVTEMKTKLARAETLRGTLAEKPSVMFVLSAEGHNIMTAGQGSSAQKVIEMAGGKLAFTDFYGYKNVSKEAIAMADPDAVLMMSSRINQLGGVEGFSDQPGFNLTTAGKEGRLLSMSGSLMLGFGPRLGDAVLELMQLLHPDLAIQPDETKTGENSSR